MHNEEISNVQVQPVDKEKIRKIWRVAAIMGVITLIEFILAFTMPRGTLLVTTFFILTIAKAFFIVAEFMHLKHETKSLIWSIMIPTVLILWLIAALIIEGDAIFTSRFGY